MPDDPGESGGGLADRRATKRALANAFMRVRVTLRMAVESLWRAGVPPPDLPAPRRRQLPSLASMQRGWLDQAVREEDGAPASVAAEPPAALPFPTEPRRPPAQGARYVGH